MNNELQALGGISVPSMSDFWTWVANTFTPSYQNEIEDYLKDSVDHSDLQSKMNTLARRGMI